MPAPKADDQADQVSELGTAPDDIAGELYNRPYAELDEKEQNAVQTILSAGSGPVISGGEDDVAEDGAVSTIPAVPGEAGTADQAGPGADSPEVAADLAGPAADSPEVAGRRQYSTKAVRAWANVRYDLPERGRIPSDVMSMFIAEHPGAEIVPVKGKAKVAAPLIPVPAGEFESEDVPEDEWESHPLSDGPVRDESQVKIDNDVKIVHAAWKGAGRPDVRHSPRKRYAVKPEHAAGVRLMLGKAGTLHKVKVHIQPARHDQHGRAVIVFTAHDKPVPKEKEEAAKNERTLGGENWPANVTVTG